LKIMNVVFQCRKEHPKRPQFTDLRSSVQRFSISFNEPISGIKLGFANLKGRPASSELLASPKPKCRCEGEEREDRDQGDVVDEGAAIGAVAGFVEEGAGGGNEHEQ
jgi:hypothetical protein